MTEHDQKEMLKEQIAKLTSAVVGAKAILDKLPFNTLEDIKSWAQLSRGIVNSLTLLEELKGKINYEGRM